MAARLCARVFESEFQRLFLKHPAYSTVLTTHMHAKLASSCALHGCEFIACRFIRSLYTYLVYVEEFFFSCVGAGFASAVIPGDT